MKSITSLCFFLFLSISINAQLVAIVGVNEGAPDGFSFVALEPLTAGTRVYFTTEEYDAGNSRFCSNGLTPCGIQEEVANWESTSAIPKGAVISIEETSSNVFTVTCDNPCIGQTISNCGNVVLVSGSFNIGTQDELYLYADSDTDPSNGVSEVYSVAYHNHGSTGGNTLPAGDDPIGDFPDVVKLDGFPIDATINQYEFDPSLRNGLVTKADLENPNKYIRRTDVSIPLSTACFGNIQVSQTCTNPAIVNAGFDTTILAGTSAFLNGGIFGGTTLGTWTSLTEAGTFSPDATTLNATYTPTAGEEAAGIARLRLTSEDPDGVGPCTPVSDTVVITILDPCANEMIPPTITCPLQQALIVDNNCQAALDDYTGLATVTVTDNCDPNPSITQSPIAGTSVTAGTTTVTLTAEDASGNSRSCLFDVEILDDSPPTFTNVPDDLTFCSGEPVVFEQPTASDNCGASVVCERSDQLALNDPYPLGTTTITCTATDGTNSISESFDITIFNAVSVSFDSECEAVYPAYAPAACIDLVPTVSGGTGPYTYTWTNNVDPGFLATTPMISVCPDENTSYNVEIIDANGCIASDKIEVQAIDISCKNDKVIICHTANQKSLCVNVGSVANHLGHGDSLGPCGLVPCASDRSSSLSVSSNSLVGPALDTEDNFTLYPNPASHQIILEFDPLNESELELIIFDISGKAVHQDNYEGVAGLNKLTIGIADLQEGMYFIQLKNGADKYQQRFLKAID